MPSIEIVCIGQSEPVGAYWEQSELQLPKSE
jgi:hypothetical protein